MRTEQLSSAISSVEVTMPKGFIEAYLHSISSVVPPEITAEAKGIVAAHRQENITHGTEILCMAGLKPQDHGYLNGLGEWISIEERRKVYNEKRKEYADDPVALQEIDVYDGETEYHDKFHQFVEALTSGNNKLASVLTEWFKKHYPDI